MRVADLFITIIETTPVIQYKIQTSGNTDIRREITVNTDEIFKTWVYKFRGVHVVPVAKRFRESDCFMSKY